MKRILTRGCRAGLAFVLALPVLCGCKAGTGGPTFSLITVYVAEVKLPEWGTPKQDNHPTTQPSVADEVNAILEK